MANSKPRNLQQIKSLYPIIGECLQDMTNVDNNIGAQTNSAPVGIIQNPVKHSALTVTAGGGYFLAQITDNSPTNRGKENFVEVSEDQNFSAGTVHVEHLGASQTLYRNYGPKKLYFRSYSQYATSGPGQPIYASADGTSGTAPTIAGNGTAAGYGTAPYTTDTIPIR